MVLFRNQGNRDPTDHAKGIHQLAISIADVIVKKRCVHLDVKPANTIVDFAGTLRMHMCDLQSMKWHGEMDNLDNTSSSPAWGLVPHTWDRTYGITTEQLYRNMDIFGTAATLFYTMAGVTIFAGVISQINPASNI